MRHTTEERRVDISDTAHFVKTKGNETPDEMDIGVESLLKEPDPRTETQATSASTMVTPLPLRQFWSREVKDKIAMVCKEQGGLAEPSRTEFLALKQRVERLELELAQKDEEHQTEIMNAGVKLQNAFKHKKNQVQKLEEQLARMKEEAGDMEYHVQSLKHQMQWQIETAQKQVEAADEKVHKYETEIRELKDERDQLRQKYYDQLSSGNDELLEAVAKSLKGLRTLESELQWIGEKAEEQKMAIVSSKSCPLFKLD
jgi:DNA repair exonuclease SbcCD ATPase subunit